MSILSSPNIINVNKLFELYKTLPDRDSSINTIELFYEFMRKESPERKRFLETCCDYSFMRIGTIAIVKAKPKI